MRSQPEVLTPHPGNTSSVALPCPLLLLSICLISVSQISSTTLDDNVLGKYILKTNFLPQKRTRVPWLCPWVPGSEAKSQLTSEHHQPSQSAGFLISEVKLRLAATSEGVMKIKWVNIFKASKKKNTGPSQPSVNVSHYYKVIGKVIKPGQTLPRPSSPEKKQCPSQRGPIAWVPHAGVGGDNNSNTCPFGDIISLKFMIHGYVVFPMERWGT